MEYKLYIGYTVSGEQTAQKVREVLEDMKFSVCSALLDDEQVLSENTKAAMGQSEKVLFISDARSKDIVKAISKVTLDTVYFITGTEKEYGENN